MINSLLRSSVNQWFATIRNDTDYRRKKIGSTFGFSIVVFIFYLIGKNLLRSAVDHFGDVAIITAINALIGIGLFVLFKDVVETTMKNFYEAREVPLLLTFPIRKSILFSMRFVELIAANLIGVFLWLLPPWIAFGQICGLNGKYYAIFSVIAFLILITIISHTVLLILGLINLFSSRRLISIFRWIAMICGLVVITAISLSMIGIDEIDELTKSLLTRIDLSQMRWLPTQPIAELMTIWIDPSSGEIWRSIAKFLINSIIWTAIAIGFGTLTFHRSWEIYHRQTEHRKKE